MVQLKYVSNFWWRLKMSLFNCEICLHLKWSKDCILVAGIVANQDPNFQITDTKIYVLLVTLSTKENN